MTASDYLQLVYRWLPSAFFIDLMIFTAVLWWKDVRLHNSIGAPDPESLQTEEHVVA